MESSDHLKADFPGEGVNIDNEAGGPRSQQTLQTRGKDQGGPTEACPVKKVDLPLTHLTGRCWQCFVSISAPAEQAGARPEPPKCAHGEAVPTRDGNLSEPVRQRQTSCAS